MNYDIIKMSDRKDHIRSYYNMTIDQLQCLLLCDTDNVAIIETVITDRQRRSHSNTLPHDVLIADNDVVYHPGDQLILDKGQKFQQNCTLIHTDVISEYSDIVTDRGKKLWIANYRLEREFTPYKKKNDNRTRIRN